MTPAAAIVLLGVLILVGIWLAVMFNLLVRQRNLVREAWSGVEVQLKRRHDLVPNLVDLVRGYSVHEREVLEQVTRARARSIRAEEVHEAAASEGALSERLEALVAVAEAYPELKADRSFLDLHHQLVEVEDQIQYARRYYNGTVRDYNTRVESFPGNLAAGLFGFRPAGFFELTAPAEHQAPSVEA